MSNYTNRLGLRIAVNEVAPSRTEITVGDKALIVPFDVEDVTAGMERWGNGEYLQVAFAFLNPDQREFLLTGLLPSEWDKLVGPEE